MFSITKKKFSKAKIIAVSGVFEGAFDESTYAKKLSRENHPLAALGCFDDILDL